VIKVDAYTKKVNKMIQQEYKNNVEKVSGDVTSTGFTIEVNESMFQMLTSNVYNDPILAVIREWSTNACDACIAGDKPINFDVHLPTLEDPTFSVRDYGTGLPEEDIVGLFSNLGASTKRDSNEFNGTFGIGRMAGLAVSDSFIVESFYNGTHYQYVITMQNGVPVTMKLGSDPTDQPNGLLLSVSVSFSDIEHYHEKAENLYKYFDHKPNLNIDTINIELDRSSHISEDWFIAKDTTYYPSNYVVMAQVPYTIPSDSKIETYGFRQLVIKAEPGSVSFNPGRESLSLNQQTVDYINKRFTEIKDEYIHAGIMHMSEQEYDSDVMFAYANLKQNAPYELRNLINPKPFLSDLYKSMVTTDVYNSSYSYLSCSTSFMDLTDNLIILKYKDSYRKTARFLDSKEYVQYDTFFKTTHVVIDVKTNFVTQLNAHFSSKSAIYWQRDTGKDIEEANAKAIETLNHFNLPYVLASEILKEYENDDTAAIKLPRQGFYASRISLSGHCVPKPEAMSESDITDLEYVYVKLKGSTPELTNVSFTTARQLLSALELTGSKINLRGVQKKYQSFIEGLDNWIDIEEYLAKELPTKTFRAPSLETIPQINWKLVGSNDASGFPEAIKNYCSEVKNYRHFIIDNTCIRDDELMKNLEAFNAKFEYYEPEVDVDLDYLDKTYPKTMVLIHKPFTYGIEDISPELVKGVAELEEFYDLHSTKAKQISN
jgi:hypothetical protein